MMCCVVLFCVMMRGLINQMHGSQRLLDVFLSHIHTFSLSESDEPHLHIFHRSIFEDGAEIFEI